MTLDHERLRRTWVRNTDAHNAGAMTLLQDHTWLAA
jgi:hypothetical protein